MTPKTPGLQVGRSCIEEMVETTGQFSGRQSARGGDLYHTLTVNRHFKYAGCLSCIVFLLTDIFQPFRLQDNKMNRRKS